MHINVQPLGQIAAEVHSFDFSKPLTTPERNAWLDALHQHLVLVIRDVPLSDQALADFAKSFGELELSPVPEGLKGTGHLPETPEIAVVSNVIVNGIPIGGLGDGEASWHTDMSYIDNPPPVCMLHGREVPPVGGDTWFTNMYAAYDSLPENLKQRIDGLVLNHDSSTTSTGTTRRGFEQVSDITRAPGARHALVKTHPGSGRKALYLGRRLNAWVVGMNVADSDALLDELWSYCSKPEHTYRHQWQVNDLIIWDNRCTMHRRDSWPSEMPRILHRAQLRNVHTS